jgi:Sap, sulfolipid-1-addressing protein
MPPEAVSLALAASLYPPALAAVIALGHGAEVRLRVVLFVAAAYVTSLVTGAAMLLLFEELSATHEAVLRPTAGLYALAGVALLVVAARLRARTPRPASASKGPSRVDRYLGSRRLVVLLGIVLYAVPSPIFVGAVKVISDTGASTGLELLYLVEMLLIMLWLIEVPMLMLIAFPVRALAALETVNAWFIRHGRALAVLACAGLGVYFLVLGAVELLTS